MGRKHLYYSVALLFLFLASCPNNPPPEPVPKVRREYADSIVKVSFSGGTSSVTFNNLNNHDIYLIKVNTSGLPVRASGTGGVRAVLSSPEASPRQVVTDNWPAPPGHPAAREFSANPPPINIENRRSNSPRAVLASPIVGDTRNFWVESYYDSGLFLLKQATLRAAGTHGNIWVMNENYEDFLSPTVNRITSDQAKDLADAFDEIYPAATNLLGFEYGGGPGGDGGKDGDPKIQIVVLDIADAAGKVMAAGFFWGKDNFPQSEIPVSNEAEIFYLDTAHVKVSPSYAYSVLVHELQHMINFNEKYLTLGTTSPTWYDEMLSMMAEDVISPMIGVGPENSSHPIRQRIPPFLATYNQAGITEWDGLSEASYAKGYAFGAYLTRNYGGASLIKSILANDATGIESINMALNEHSPGMDFDQVLGRFGEAIVFSGDLAPLGSVTFDKTVSSVINSITYTAYGFDVWNINRPRDAPGPFVFDVAPMDMRPYSVLIQSARSWKRRSGNVTVTLVRPDNPGIEMYLLVW